MSPLFFKGNTHTQKKKIKNMRRIIVILILIATTQLFAVANTKLPTVYVIATGGTIAGSGNTGTTTAYKPGVLSVEDLLKSVPELAEIADVKAVQFANIASQDMTTKIMNELVKLVNNLLAKQNVSGVVITHGTDTMEETAYFLSLTTNNPKPVVLVGSMRPSTAISADGPQNLFNAVLVAASQNSSDKGVMVAMNNKVFDAQGVTKFHTTDTEAFTSHNYGVKAYISNRDVEYINLQKHKSIFTVSDNYPNVAILYAHTDTDSDIVDFLVAEGYKGIVLAGVGHGNTSQKTLNALIKASENGVLVVRSSKVGSGKVTSKGEVDDNKYGFTSSGYLSPVQARILLMLSLQSNDGNKTKAIEMFNKNKNY